MIHTEKSNMTFLEHLEELRWHLIRAILSVLIFAILAFVFRGIIFDTIILAPKSPEFITNRLLCQLGEIVHSKALCINAKNLQIINIKMAGQFSTHIIVSIVAGLLVAFPYVFYEFWLFLKPALYDKEKKHARGAVFFSSTLFSLGILFGYYVITPLSVHFLGSYNVSNEVVNQINLGSYINTITSVALASGVIFELPIFIYFLSKIGLVTPDFLKKYRRHAIILILALSAIITPPDIFSQVLVCFPLILLYEVGIVISRRIARQHDALFEDDEDEEPEEQEDEEEQITGAEEDDPDNFYDLEEDELTANDEDEDDSYSADDPYGLDNPDDPDNPDNPSDNNKGPDIM